MKAGLILLAIVVVFVTNISRWQESWLANTEAKAVVQQWADRYHGEPPDLLTEYAPLPAHDRSLISYYCADIYQQHQLLVGTKENLDSDYKLGCQALMHGGWHPAWTIKDGLDYVADPSKYLLR